MVRPQDHLGMSVVLATIGCPFALTGGLLMLWLPLRMTDRIQALRDSPPLTRANLTVTNTEVWVEGTLTERNSTLVGDLVAFRRFIWVINQEGERKLTESAGYTPELELEIADGTLTVAENYRIGLTTGVFQRGKESYEGLQEGDRALLVVGTVLTDDPPTIQASLVTAETKAEYLQGRRAQRRFVTVLGFPFACIGLCFLLGSTQAMRTYVRACQQEPTVSSEKIP
jgi:hypothetical protein